MRYFTELSDYKTYDGHDDDFHFSYNANTGGGQSFLGGKFHDVNGELVSPSTLNGRVAVLRFGFLGADQINRVVILDDESAKYEIKPRATGDSNMKFSVGNKFTPSQAVAAFLMLPDPCGVKKALNIDTSVLSVKNFWLQSMWMDVEKGQDGTVLLTARDCVFGGGVGENGGTPKYFTVDIQKRINDIIKFADDNSLDVEVTSSLKTFADVYNGVKMFSCEECATVVKGVMKFLAAKYPDRYSGTIDPLMLISELSSNDDEKGLQSDLLTSALKLFKEKRNEFAMGEKVNEGIRAYFDPLTEEGLRNFTEEQFTDLFLGKEKYEHMWSGTNGKGWGHIKNAGREAAMNFIADLKAIPVPAEEFCDKGFDAPSGFGRVTIAELQMKFRPTEFCAYSKRTAAAFRILKLDEREFNGNFTAEDYNAILAITETVRSKMEEMGIGLTRKDASKPDYLSANEFVDFVLQNETLILQEWGKQMKHEIDAGKQEPIAGSEGFKAFIEKFHEAADKAGLTYDLDLVRRFVCAMLAKKRPFVILTGLSGSGKTKLAEAFSKWMGVEHTHMLVSVGADWTNSEKLLGFPNALEPKQYVSPDTGVLQFLRDAEQNPDVQFFLILDEMNLSHVECYFADFLSAMESSDGVIRLYDGGEREDENGVALKPAITFPKNLFIIGTMNVDETTRASSPKVLDRAQVIEFRVSKGDLAKFLDEPKELDLDSLDGQGKAYSKAFLDLHDKVPALDKDGKTTNRDEISSALKTIFEPLAELGAEFGYRTAGEAMRFCAYDLHAGAGIVPAIDAAVMQKLLPKLHGSQARLGRVLREIAELSEEEYEVSEEGGEKKKAKRPKYPLTHEKVVRMTVRVKANGFTGFAEA